MRFSPVQAGPAPRPRGSALTAAFSPDAGAHRGLKARGRRDRIQDGPLAGEGRVQGQVGWVGAFAVPQGRVL